mmetsp:Transcript_2966/g.6612  ORF Transcript_2966/g.6612 Transcript_2966/m.6612 type:complete len:258 (-) Transcript_2966:309-1082(-)
MHECMTTSSNNVDFFDLKNGDLKNVEEVHFANWETGPVGPQTVSPVDPDNPQQTVRALFSFFAMPSLKRVYAPRLQGNSNLIVSFTNNPMLAKVDLPALTDSGGVRIFSNPELVDVNFRRLKTVTSYFQVIGNPRLETLCASNLVEAGTVCIGNKEGDDDPQFPIEGQTNLDANLKKLVTGSFNSHRSIQFVCIVLFAMEPEPSLPWMPTTSAERSQSVSSPQLDACRMPAPKKTKRRKKRKRRKPRRSLEHDRRPT